MGNRYYRQDIDIDNVIAMYGEGLTQIEIAQRLGTTQKVIWARLREVGYKCRIPKKSNQWGENNDSWKGNKAGYAALHYRLYNKLGCPRHCGVCGTDDKDKKYEWANLTGKYDDVGDYKRMCQSCHAKHDGMEKNFKKGVMPNDTD